MPRRRTRRKLPKPRRSFIRGWSNSPNISKKSAPGWSGRTRPSTTRRRVFKRACVLPAKGSQNWAAQIRQRNWRMCSRWIRHYACRRVKFRRKTKNPEKILRVFIEKLAATYSRRTYRTTTIGKTVFDGRVRNGIGSDHSFMATKKRKSEASTRSSNFHSELRPDFPTKFKRTYRVKSG